MYVSYIGLMLVDSCRCKNLKGFHVIISYKRNIKRTFARVATLFIYFIHVILLPIRAPTIAYVHLLMTLISFTYAFICEKYELDVLPQFW